MSAVIEDTEQDLIDSMGQFMYDPLAYAHTMYPWRQPGTPFADWDGPDIWQAQVLRDIGSHMEAVAHHQVRSPTTQVAVRSGHGIGKSFLMSILVAWFLSTRAKPQIVVTAGTDTQLRTKLWRELNKTYQHALNAHWFDWRATSFGIKGEDIQWRANAIPWSKSYPAAFQGTHEDDVLVLFDEASAIDDVIWDASEGAFTTRGGLWVCFGNPTSEIGRFADCFGRFKHRWMTYTVDSREAKAADKEKMNAWVEDYGEDSDFVRIRVRGLPPKSSATGLISASLVAEAQGRDIREEYIPLTIPRVCGIDVGGGGAGRTVLVFRRGPLVREQDIFKFSESNHMVVAEKIAVILSKERPEAVFLDAHGIGKGVYDRLIQLGYHYIVPSYGGDRSMVQDTLVYYNPRAEWWGRMAKWLTESKIPQDADLRDELVAQPIDYDMQNRIKLMAKQDMREIGLPSPDTGDALALTFAQTVAPTAVPGFSERNPLPDVV